MHKNENLYCFEKLEPYSHENLKMSSGSPLLT